MSDLVFGLDVFGDVPEDDTGALLSDAAAIRQVVDEAVLADELGVDVVALGEHHRPEFSISTPETVLAGIATRTSRIRLASGVTVLIIGGPPKRFASYIELYRRAAEQFATAAYPVGMHSPGFIADTDEEAKEVFWPRYRVIRDRIGALRGWPPTSRAEFDSEVEHGSLYIGSPRTVARKIAGTIKDLGVGRFDLIYTAGSQPAGARMRAVELYGGKVIPMVRDILATGK